MTSLINFRDFGDKPTASGAHVRRDLLYRSGHLGGLSQAQGERVLAMEFAAIVDLRYPDERREMLSPWPQEALDRVIVHDGAADREAPHVRMFREARAGAKDFDDAYLAFNRALPFDRWYRPLFVRGLNRIARATGRVLIHCSAGKDRTGALAALLLELLDVPRDVIVADYMESQDAPGFDRLREHLLRRLVRSGGGELPPETMNAMIAVKPDYLHAFFDTIEQRSGSVRAYLAEGGLEEAAIDALQARLLAR